GLQGRTLGVLTGDTFHLRACRACKHLPSRLHHPGFTTRPTGSLKTNALKSLPEPHPRRAPIVAPLPPVTPDLRGKWRCVRRARSRPSRCPAPSLIPSLLRLPLALCSLWGVLIVHSARSFCAARHRPPLSSHPLDPPSNARSAQKAVRNGKDRPAINRQ